MRYSILVLATTCLLTSAVHAREWRMTACDIRVTQNRNVEEAVCYENHGPPVPGYDVTAREALDSCLDVVQSKFYLGRYSCPAGRTKLRSMEGHYRLKKIIGIAG